MTANSELFEDSLLTADDTVESFLIEPTGIVSHSRYPTNNGTGLSFNVANTLTISGSINGNAGIVSVNQASGDLVNQANIHAIAADLN